MLLTYRLGWHTDCIIGRDSRREGPRFDFVFLSKCFNLSPTTCPTILTLFGVETFRFGSCSRHLRLLNALSDPELFVPRLNFRKLRAFVRMFFFFYTLLFFFLPLPLFLSSIFHGGWLVGHSHWAVKSLSRLQGVQHREFDWPLGSRSSAWWLLVTANYPQFFAGPQTKRPDALLSLTSVTVQFSMPSNMCDIMARNWCLPLAGFPNISAVFHWLSKPIVPSPTRSWLYFK